MPDNNETINGETRTFGIIGNPVHHSLSPEMHNAAFRALNLNCIYVPLPTTNIREAVAGVRSLGFRGISVTIPYKQDVMPLVDHIDSVAEQIGAVNTLLIKKEPNREDPVLYGSNTDWVGANRALSEQLELQGSRILLVGAGGAARALGFGFRQAGAEVVVTNRTAEKGKQLADHLGGHFVDLIDLGQIQGDALVDATSVGMIPDSAEIPVNPGVFRNFSVVMDVVYAPVETRLLREAAEAGCAVVDGLSMLLYQGVAQFELWTGREAPVDIMRDVVYNHLKAKSSH